MIDAKIVYPTGDTNPQVDISVESLPRIAEAIRTSNGKYYKVMNVVHDQLDSTDPKILIWVALIPPTQ